MRGRVESRVRKGYADASGRSDRAFRAAWVLGAAMLISALSLAATAELAWGEAGSQTIAIPSYFYPDSGSAGSLWDRTDDGAPAVSLAVVNPASGPGETMDPAYAAQVEKSQAAGLTVLGYVSTAYAGTTNPDRTVEAVEADVDKFYEWYGVDGIFLDEASTDCQYADSPTSYYNELNQHVKAKGGEAVVAINPGVQTNECYMSVSDIVVNFEGSHEKYASSYSAPDWVKGHDPGHFWHLVYDSPDATTMKQDVTMSKERNAGLIYVTPDVLPNPWDTLPSVPYFEAEKQQAVDSTVPLITPVSPKPGAVIRDRTPTIRAKVTDNPYDLLKDDIELYVAGKRIQAASTRYSDGTLSYTPRPLAMGRNTVKVVVADHAGNTTQRAWAFRVR